MTGDINVAGVFVPTFAVCCVVALGLIVLLHTVFKRFEFPLHRFVWHPPLFDLAVFVIFLGAVYAVLHVLLS
jgi:hypothetical protein